MPLLLSTIRAVHVLAAALIALLLAIALLARSTVLRRTVRYLNHDLQLFRAWLKSLDNDLFRW
jgi:hypothetical protein